MTYRLVLNDRSIRSLTNDDLNGPLKSKLGYIKFRRVPIQKARPTAMPMSSRVGIATAAKDIFYLFFENEAQANAALNIAKSIPIISLMKYRPNPCVGVKHKPIDVKPKASPSHKVGTLPQNIVDIPRIALSKHRSRFADTDRFCDCMRQLCKEIYVRRLSTDEILKQVQHLTVWIDNNPTFRVSCQKSTQDLIDTFFKNL